MGNEDAKIHQYQWSNLRNQYLAAFVGNEKIRKKTQLIYSSFFKQRIFISANIIFLGHGFMNGSKKI